MGKLGAPDVLNSIPSTPIRISTVAALTTIHGRIATTLLCMMRALSGRGLVCGTVSTAKRQRNARAILFAQIEQRTAVNVIRPIGRYFASDYLSCRFSSSCLSSCAFRGSATLERSATRPFAPSHLGCQFVSPSYPTVNWYMLVGHAPPKPHSDPSKPRLAASCLLIARLSLGSSPCCPAGCQRPSGL